MILPLCGAALLIMKRVPVAARRVKIGLKADIFAGGLGVRRFG